MEGAAFSVFCLFQYPHLHITNYQVVPPIFGEASEIMYSARTKTFAINSLFATFFLTAFGWGLLHTWAVQVGARGLFHLFVAVPGLSMCGVVLFRYSRHWPTRQADEKKKSRLSLSYRSLIWYFLLAAIGLVMALLMQVGSAFILVCAASGLILVPWFRISVCRNHFFVSVAAIGAGAAIGLTLLGKPMHPLHYPISAWVYLSMSCVMTVFVIMVHRNQFTKMPPSGY